MADNPFDFVNRLQPGATGLQPIDYTMQPADPWQAAVQPVPGQAPPPMVQEAMPTTPQPRVPYAAPQIQQAPTDDLDVYLNALAMGESGGNYGALGPVVRRGQYAGQRALGKYQIMPGNLGQWLAEAGLPLMSPEEFRASPQAQEALARQRFGGYVRQYGPEGAAAMWFSGQPNPNAPGDDDYTTIANYVQRFKNNLGRPMPGPGAVGQVPQSPAQAGQAAFQQSQGQGQGNLPPGVARSGWGGILDVGLGGMQNQRDFAFGQAAGRQQAAGRIVQRMGEIAAEHPNANGNQIVQLTIRDPLWGRHALDLGANAVSILQSTAAALRPAPAEGYTLSPGQQRFIPGQTEPVARVSAIQEPFTLGPGQERFQPGQPGERPTSVARVAELDPMRGPVAQQRANILGTAAQKAEPAGRMIGGLGQLQNLSNNWHHINGNAGLMNQFRVFAAQYAPGLAVRGDSTAQEFAAIVSGMIANLPRTPGAVSDFETRQLVNQLPGLAGSKEGRDEIIKRLTGIARTAESEARIATAAMNGQISEPDALEFLGAPRDIQVISHFQAEHPELPVDDIFRMNTQSLAQLRDQIAAAYGGPDKVPSPLRRLIQSRYEILRRRDNLQ